MAEKDFYFLLSLARKMQLHGKIKTSTGTLAKELNISQQTVSRKLQEFSEHQLIVREATPAGVTIKLAQKGRERLSVLYGELQSLFQQQPSLKGVVKNGLGEGRFYMSQEQYRRQFESLLGYVPFCGTLNLAVDKDSAAAFLASRKQLYVSGFTSKERTFGGLRCCPVQVGRKISGAVIVPDRTMHALDTIEVIAAINIRDALKLKNGKQIMIN